MTKSCYITPFPDVLLERDMLIERLLFTLRPELPSVRKLRTISSQPGHKVAQTLVISFFPETTLIVERV